MSYNEEYAEFQKRFGYNLRKILKQKGFTQRKQILAGLDVRYIARLKAGKISPTVKSIYKLASIIKVDPIKFFEGYESIHCGKPDTCTNASEDLPTS